VASPEIENIGSWKVLEKCRMTYTGDGGSRRHPVKTYQIRNPSVR